ncbi:MAG: transcriptional regulator [Crocinitomicaceae bacterium]
MKQSVNYIKHLESWADRICCDDRLTPHHISLYYAMFHQWNLAKFKNPISICRSELMLACKIGSANTYTKCLKQLDNWGYIEYKPSYNPARGSLVNLYNFDNSTGKGSDKGTDKGAVIAVRPSLNYKKPYKQYKQEKALLSKTETRTESSASRRTYFTPPSLDEVKEFFIDLKSTVSEAENFHNYFESNGWLVGGKAKMKNWQAAAKNWLKRSAKFNSSDNGAKNRLHTNDDKEYATPL